MSLTGLITELSKGMLTSVEIFTLTLVFSLPLGLFVAFGRMSKNLIIRNIFRIYISIMRGTPLILQLMVVYFGPFYIFKIPLSYAYRFQAVIIGFVLNYAAYFAEIYRGGIESISVGQYEAAKVLGYSSVYGVWLSLVERLVRDQEAGGSNPLTPTIIPKSYHSALGIFIL